MDGQPGGHFAETPGQVTAGALLTYTLSLSNDGPSAAENVVLQDELPAGLSVHAVTASQGSCSAGQAVKCGLGVLPAGAGATVTVAVEAAPWLPDGTVLNNQAWIGGDVFDDDNGDNWASAPVLVTTAADLWIEKTQNIAAMAVGKIEYDLTVGNDGPSHAQYTLVSDTLPAAVTSASWTCLALDGATCPAGGSGDLLTTVDLPPGSRVIIEIRGRVVLVKTLTNTASVAPGAGVDDPYPANNQATVVATITRLYLPVAIAE